MYPRSMPIWHVIGQVYEKWGQPGAITNTGGYGSMSMSPIASLRRNATAFCAGLAYTMIFVMLSHSIIVLYR